MILIVGGAGYIGSHVNKELNKRGYETIVYDNLICGHREAVKWGRFARTNRLEQIVEGKRDSIRKNKKGNRGLVKRKGVKFNE